MITALPDLASIGPYVIDGIERRKRQRERTQRMHLLTQAQTGPVPHCTEQEGTHHQERTFLYN